MYSYALLNVSNYEHGFKLNLNCVNNIKNPYKYKFVNK